MKILECLMPAFYKKQNIILTFVAFIIALLLLGIVQTKSQTIDSTWIFSSETLTKFDNYIKENAPEENAFVVVKWLVARFIQAKQWEKAADVFEKYRPLFKVMGKRFEKIIGVLNAPDEGLIVSNLGSGINTDSSEYCPIPTTDGLKLYFTGLNRDDCIGGEDIFVSEFQNGSWGKAMNLGSSINTDSHEDPMAISADGNRIILFGNYEESLGRGDIFYIDKTQYGWSKKEHFPEPINSEYFDADAFLTSDGKAILFTSDRPGGIGDFHKKDTQFDLHFEGNIDIYISFRTDTGWSKPINLGTSINTPYCERTPFLHPDGKTFYFSSDGHYGLGGLDVFKSVRLNDTSWTEWSEPVNLGKEINTIEDDWGYKVATTGEIAYFSARNKKGGFGKQDIYSITLPKAVRPEEVATIRGVVTDQDGKPIEAGIKWEDLTAQKNVGELKTNPADGSYFITMPLGKMYGYYAEKEGYYPVSENIDLTGKKSSLNITENIVLVSIKKMKEDSKITVPIHNIFFDFDKYELKKESNLELNRLAKILKENPDTKVEIDGHTDNLGTNDYNINLSRNRAESVVAYLISQGCIRKNLISKGFGKSKPIASNDTEEGRAQNRRVEFKFVR